MTLNKIVAIVLLLLTISCVSKTNYGQCVGIQEKQNPNLTYKINWWNVFISFTFIKAVFPVVILFDRCLYCPVGDKKSE